MPSEYQAWLPVLRDTSEESRKWLFSQETYFQVFMALCKYCGEPAGLLSSFHQACKHREERRERGTNVFLSRAVPYVRQYVSGEIDSEMAHELIATAGKEWNRSAADIQAYLCEAWGQSLADFLEDGVLDEREEERLQSFIDDFQLSTETLQAKGYLQKALKAQLLRRVLNGEEFSSPFSDDSIPFNLQANEIAAWIFPRTKYIQEVTERRYVGGSIGGSVRVAKGVYLRQSSFRGHPVETRSAKNMGIGTLVLTTKHIYWKSSSDSLRIPYTKIISFAPCDDGITVVKDLVKALPQTFITGDGWGTYNLAVNLARLY
jgi:hypothetical protein